MMIKASTFAPSQLRGLRPLARAPKRPYNRSSITPLAIMSGYQYQMKAEKLRSRGLDVKEFGGRVLREGCFGEDVLALQNWLAEETYYNALDGGMTGYFGSVTKEALQNWQRDNKLEATGVFDDASKWQYLQSCEARLATRMQQHQSTTHAATVAATAATSSASSAITTAATATAPYVAIAAIAFAATIATKRFISPLLISFFTRTPKSTSSDQQQQQQNQERVTISPSNKQQPQQQQQPRNTKQQQQQKEASRLRRLSDEELQRYIAPMKGSSPSRTPIQRPAPRPLSLSDSTTTNQGAVKSKYGTYYGGRQVLERVKEYLRDESGHQAPVGATAQRMQAIGYDTLRQKKNNNNNTTTAPRQQSTGILTVKQQKNTDSSKNDATPLVSPLQRAQSPLKSFQDVDVDDVSAVAATVPSQALLSGTDLEAAPVERIKARPVAVVKSNSKTANAHGDVAVGVKKEVVMDPSATVVLSHKPIKVHKPARLASGVSYDDDGDL